MYKFIHRALGVLSVLSFASLLAGALVYNTVGSEVIDSWKDPASAAFIVFVFGLVTGGVSVALWAEGE